MKTTFLLLLSLITMISCNNSDVENNSAEADSTTHSNNQQDTLSDSDNSEKSFHYKVNLSELPGEYSVKLNKYFDIDSISIHENRIKKNLI